MEESCDVLVVVKDMMDTTLTKNVSGENVGTMICNSGKGNDA